MRFNEIHDDHHERFRQLCALAVSGSLSPLESAELRAHLRECESCAELLAEYQVLATHGMAALADTFAEGDPLEWDEARARRRLVERLRVEHEAPAIPTAEYSPGEAGYLSRFAKNPLLVAGLAASLVLAASYGGYHFGTMTHGTQTPHTPSFSSVLPSNGDQLQKLAAEKAAANALLASQADQLAALQKLSNEKERELEKLRLELQAAQGRAAELSAANGQADEKLREALQERDSLNARLSAASQSYDKDRADLAKLRTEHDGTLIRTTSLESRIGELSATNRDQERRLKEAEQFLSSDRDIRELMGARKLYIADVFDVDGSSRTQRPFGRVFYTQGKSLIFYAFDLDRQPKVVNASAFQVWGQRETPQGEKPLPMNLGILYMDNEANRRWVMRFDDPKQLAEIDAVFVTVEPHGGSPKPTSKPFLYALLRNEANHP
jgi:hypothetical protein